MLERLAMRAVRSLSARYRRRQTRKRIETLKRQLRDSTVFDYTVDYVSGQSANWSQHFDGLGGTAIRILEIGSYEGRSAVWFLSNVLAHPDSRIVCVDPFLDPCLELRFDHNIRIAGHPEKLTKMKGFSGSILSSLAAESFDLIYVDGSHQAADALLDGTLSWPLLKPHGSLLFDDYQWRPDLPSHARPELGVDLFLEHLRGRYELVFRGYQVLIRKPGPPQDSGLESYR